MVAAALRAITEEAAALASGILARVRQKPRRRASTASSFKPANSVLLAQGTAPEQSRRPLPFRPGRSRVPAIQIYSMIMYLMENHINMLDSALVQTRIDPALTDKASLMLAQMGLTVSDAVRMLLTRVANDGTPGRARRRSSDL